MNRREQVAQALGALKKLDEAYAKDQRFIEYEEEFAELVKYYHQSAVELDDSLMKFVEELADKGEQEIRADVLSDELYWEVFKMH